MSSFTWVDILLQSALEFCNDCELRKLFSLNRHFETFRANDHTLYSRLSSKSCSISNTFCIDRDLFYDHPLCERTTKQNQLTDLSATTVISRTLTHSERKFFRTVAVHGDDLTTFQQNPYTLSISLQSFLNQLEDVFSFHEWADTINFNNFILAGGSVLTSITQTAQRTQDLDFFALNPSYHIMRDQVSELTDRLRLHYGDVVQKTRYAKNLTSQIDSVTSISAGHLKFQFIAFRFYRTPEEVLDSFDMDICMVAFDGFNIKATKSFIHALQTSTYYYKPNYFLEEYPTDPIPHTIENHADQRIAKYRSRGYIFLGYLNP